MNILERWIAERDARPRVAVEIDGWPCEPVSTLTVDARDWDALLTVAEAVRRGCLAMCDDLCFRDEITRVEECMDCVLAGAADALAPLLEEESDEQVGSN